MFEVFLIGHIAAGVIAVLAGTAAMLTPKTPGRHPRRGTVYLAAVEAAPPSSFWFLPAAVGAPLLLRALYRHARRTRREEVRRHRRML
ncbi:MAG: hypothetical protein ACRDST_19385 [Pseudonocardiaceae bacterium]